MLVDDFNVQFSEVISALNSTQFTTKLIRLIQSVIHFDSAVILGYREGKRPIYLYDSIENNRELLFQHYLNSSFESDPFYQKLISSKQQGIFGIADVVCQDFKYQAYLKQFYLQTGWKDELSILIEIESKRWVMICLGYTREDKVFDKRQIASLKSYFELIQSLCQQHWKQQTEFTLAEPVTDADVSSTNIRQQINNALVSFGSEILTKREQEITSLIAQGYDSREIAQKLEVTEGTVKNHRKRIYTQLKVSSLSELFQLFLNHIILQSK